MTITITVKAKLITVSAFEDTISHLGRLAVGNILEKLGKLAVFLVVLVRWGVGGNHASVSGCLFGVNAL